MANEKPKQITIENFQPMFRNFTGREQPFNKEGDRNFCVPLDDQTASQMIEDGWNVKYTKPGEDEEIGRPYLPVAVSFKIFPPSITIISSTARTRIFEDSVEMLDQVDISFMDIICTGYDWEVNGKTGTKAYLKTMFITINEDELELKYAVRNDGENG